jgi:hypothetical protein
LVSISFDLALIDEDLCFRNFWFMAFGESLMGDKPRDLLWKKKKKKQVVVIDLTFHSPIDHLVM